MKDSPLEIEKRKLKQLHDRILKCHLSQKVTIIEQLWEFLHMSSAFKPLTTIIAGKYTSYETHAYDYYHMNYAVPLPTKLNDQVYQIYFVLKIALKDYREPTNFLHLGKQYYRRLTASDEQAFEMFNNLFLEPFVFYFLNEADRHLLILEILKKYQQRTEWFEKDSLLQRMEATPKTREKIAKQHLLAYLYDQGLEVNIEPQSPSGNADFIATLKDGSNSSIIEAKIFNEKSNEASFLQAFRQTERYVKDHTEKVAYITIYTTTELTLSIQLDRESGISYLAKDGHLYYFIVIDLYRAESTASKTKQRKPISIIATTFQ